MEVQIHESEEEVRRSKGAQTDLGKAENMLLACSVTDLIWITVLLGFVLKRYG